MSEATILVIDDEAGIRESLRGVLEDEGFRVLAAADAEKGIELALAHRPEVVLLDIWLPGMDGMECLRRLRAEAPESQVIMISGHGSVETAVAATKLGAYDYIEKPLSLERVLLQIKHAVDELAIARERDELRGRLGDGEGAAGELPAGADYLAVRELRDARAGFEREFIARRLAECGGDLARAAAEMGIERAQLVRLIRRLGVAGPAADPDGEPDQPEIP